MAITTYTELKAAISKWVVHDDVDSTVQDELIDLFEASFKTSPHARHYFAETREEHTVPAGETHQYVTLPSNWAGGRAVRRDCVDMQYLPPEKFDLVKANDVCSTVDDVFKGFYTIENQAVRLYPAAAEGQVIELLFWEDVTPLDDTNTANWLLTNFPQIYLYGSLMHAGPFLKDDVDLNRIGEMFKFSIDQLKKDSSRRKYGGGTMRQQVV